jgi:hypothetical protein
MVANAVSATVRVMFFVVTVVVSTQHTMTVKSRQAASTTTVSAVSTTLAVHI